MGAAAEQVALKQTTGQVTVCDSAAGYSLHETHLRRENIQLLLQVSSLLAQDGTPAQGGSH